MLRLGCINYINTLPLFAAILHGHVKLSDVKITLAPPAKLNQMLLQDDLDISLISSIEFLKNRDHLQHVFPFGIAAKQAVQSVLLFHREPIKLLNKKKVALTEESATSVALLKILCKHYWKCTPYFEIIDPNIPIETYDAYLLIGDKALLARQETSFQMTDLANAWFQFTDLFMPFGILAAKKTLSKEILSKCKLALYESLKWGQEHVNEVILLATNQLYPGSTQKNDLKIRISNYFDLLTFIFNKKELAGLEKFATYVR
ncbi:MAG: menaquinone biosynthesis protein [Chlamydiales bacterium]|nr:menaquinone biosynthesis protein [Chlamydiales bacterium]